MELPLDILKVIANLTPHTWQLLSACNISLSKHAKIHQESQKAKFSTFVEWPTSTHEYPASSSWILPNGLNHGVSTFYYHGSSQVQFENNYATGRLHGEQREWNKSGDLICVANYSHGALDGGQYWYGDDGHRSTSKFFHGVLIETVEFDPKTNTKKEDTYVHGTLAVRKYWKNTPDGVFVRTSLYKDGHRKGYAKWKQYSGLFPS